MSADFLTSYVAIPLFTISDIDGSSGVSTHETGLQSEGLIIRISLIQQMTESNLYTYAYIKIKGVYGRSAPVAVHRSTAYTVHPAVTSCRAVMQ